MSKNVTTAFIVAIILLLGVGVYFAPTLYRDYQKKIAQEKHLEGGLDSFASGDLQSAEDQFKQGVDNAMTPDERARFEILLAATYENSDFRRSADMYLKVVNNPSYSNEIRSYAASYLLLALSNRYDLTIAQQIFSVAPWEGYMNNRVSDQRLNYETAITRGHEWAIALSPNFLSYLLAGEFYARHYADFPEGQKKEVVSKLLDYYDKGSEQFAVFAATPQSHENVIASGYRVLGVYGEELNALVKSGIVAPKDGVISDSIVDGVYVHGEGYMKALKDSPFKNVMLLTTYLHHGHFLLSLDAPDKNRLQALGDSLAQLIATDRESARNVNAYGKATNPGMFLMFRKTLISLGGHSSKLKEALIDQTDSFTAKDFVSK